MKKIEKMNTEMEKMATLLEQYPSYRETKYKPIAHRIYEDLPQHLRTFEVKEVLKLLAEAKELPAIETLSRAWRKVLEQHPDWVSAKHDAQRKQQAHEMSEAMNNIGR